MQMTSRSQRGPLLGGAIVLAMPLIPGWSPAARAQSPLYDIEGTFHSGEFASVVRRLGDVDADGTRDFAIGAPKAGHGSVIVVSGATRDVLLSLLGDDQQDQFGSAIDSAGDVNRDGHDDLLIGAQKDDPFSWVASRRGTVRVCSGADGSVLHLFSGQAAYEEMGVAVSNAGDVDGDSYDDWMFGTGKGIVRVYSGQTALLLYTFVGDTLGDGFGLAVSGAGDVDGDGLADMAVGARAGNYVRLFSGSGGGVIRTVTGIGAFGRSLSLAGDVDRDGRDDLIVGSPHEINPGGSGGAVRVISGADGSTLHTFRADEVNDYLGESVGGGLDVDGDGWPDIIAGAPNARPLPNVLAYGEVRVYSGRDGSVLYTTSGSEWLGRYGEAVDFIADVEGDGAPDLLVGAPGDGTYGRAFVLSGGCRAPVTYCTAKVSSNGCVPSIGYRGIPSASGPDTFHVTASSVMNLKLGMLFWGIRPNGAPVLGGYRCVYSFHRTIAQNSGGNPVPDCSGTFDFHFSQALMTSAGIPAGMTLYAQYWYRDPGFPAPGSVGMTDALRFTVCE